MPYAHPTILDLDARLMWRTRARMRPNGSKHASHLDALMLLNSIRIHSETLQRFQKQHVTDCQRLQNQDHTGSGMDCGCEPSLVALRQLADFSHGLLLRSAGCEILGSRRKFGASAPNVHTSMYISL